MKVRAMIPSDLEQIVRLHKKTLPYTASSKIGLIYLFHLYRILLTNADINITLVAVNKNKVIGALTATIDLNKTQKMLSPLNSLTSSKEIIKSLLNSSLKLYELFNRLWFEYSLLKKYSSPYATVLTLFVEASHQKKGVGKKLLLTAIEDVRKNKIKTLYVDTLITNSQAIAFYKKLGFKKIIKLTDSFVLNLRIPNS